MCQKRGFGPQVLVLFPLREWDLPLDLGVHHFWAYLYVLTDTTEHSHLKTKDCALLCTDKAIHKLALQSAVWKYSFALMMNLALLAIISSQTAHCNCVLSKATSENYFNYLVYACSIMYCKCTCKFKCKCKYECKCTCKCKYECKILSVSVSIKVNVSVTVNVNPCM